MREAAKNIRNFESIKHNRLFLGRCTSLSKIQSAVPQITYHLFNYFTVRVFMNYKIEKVIQWWSFLCRTYILNFLSDKVDYSLCLKYYIDIINRMKLENWLAFTWHHRSWHLKVIVKIRCRHIIESKAIFTCFPILSKIYLIDFIT